MKRRARVPATVLLVLATLAPAASSAEDVVVGVGHIAAGNPAVDTYSIAVLGEAAYRPPLPAPDTNGIDGFFLPAPPEGTLLSTITTDVGGLGYAMNINFHSDARTFLGTRTWLGGCSPGWFVGAGRPHLETARCPVPRGATTVEVSADWGVDLRVTLMRVS